MTGSADPTAWAIESARQGHTAIAIAAALAHRCAVRAGLVIDSSAPELFRRHRATDLPDLPFGLEPDPWSLGRAFEVAHEASSRRQGGVHYTPPLVARSLAAIALEAATPATTVCDPAVGGGAFLLAAAEHLERLGATPEVIVERCLWGVDVDPDAIDVATAALACHASRAGRWLGPGGHLAVGDTLESGSDVFGDAMPDGFDVVIGNPPFQGQLAGATARSADQGRRLRERWQVSAGPYADTAGYFVLAALELAAPDGRVVMIQPRSVLVANGAGPIRRAVGERSHLSGLWTADLGVFDAEVWVCALVLDRRNPTTAPPMVRRWSGSRADPVPPSRAPSGSDSWAGLVAGASAALLSAVLDRFDADSARSVGSMATATAGFRDQFYGLAPHTSEWVDDAGGASAPLVTVGMIDPFRSRWGSDEFRYAGRRWRRPIVDLDALDAATPRLAAWVTARLRPKLIVATQTRVLEVLVDTGGRWIPSTPAIAVEAPADRLFHLAAALTSPVTTAIALNRVAGAALSIDTIKLSARQLLALPLPQAGSDWDQGAAWAKRAAGAGDEATWREALDRLGRHMIAAAGLSDPDDELHRWWWQRLPPWR